MGTKKVRLQAHRGDTAAEGVTALMTLVTRGSLGENKVAAHSSLWTQLGLPVAAGGDEKKYDCRHIEVIQLLRE